MTSIEDVKMVEEEEAFQEPKRKNLKRKMDVDVSYYLLFITYKFINLFLLNLRYCLSFMLNTVLLLSYGTGTAGRYRYWYLRKI